MSRGGYYFKLGSLALFFALFLLILLIGPVFHNHTWQLVEPSQCPAFFLEQVFSGMVIFFLIITLFYITEQSSFVEFYQSPLKRIKLCFVQINRPPPLPL